MTKNEEYYFHQTPQELAKQLIEKTPLTSGDKVLEPFKGEGAFYDNLPDFVEKDWCEIEEGRDFQEYDKEIDWVVSNPPFKLDNQGVRENAFYKIIKYFLPKVKKGIAFLGNDYCFSTLTPKRLKELNDGGLYLHKIVVCNVKKWRGRYFYIIFEKRKSDNYQYLEQSF
jgi:hypothetical protein